MWHLPASRFRASSIYSCIDSSFLFVAKLYAIVWIQRNLFIHASVVGHVGCLQFEAIAITAITNICAQPSHRPVFPLLLNKRLGVKWLDGRLGKRFTF